ncbi:MAG: extracellular solute-binding protein [Desulfovibrio sp.]|uniref:extracellular solute-binding protein n=1 Tax=Desulfovibrio sp. 7SRBS1 TaxID=3378064 RepID=UPI003B40F135
MKRLLAISLTAMCLFLSGLTAQAADSGEKVLYVYNWSEYMPQDVLDQFTEETGIKVVYNTFDSNESMFAKLKLVKGGYDVVVPSTYFVSRMKREGMLEKIDKSKLPNFKNLDPALLNTAYDPENAYSIPYLWGTTGIGVRTDRHDPATVTAYADLWKPEYKGQVLLTDDIREVFGMAFLVLGYPFNDTNPKHIEEAYKKLTELMPNVVLFNSDAPRMPFLNEEVSVGLIWNGEVNQANTETEGETIAYVYPKEGTIAWVDNLCIPAGAKHIDEAHAFINFLLRPDIAKVICEEIGYATPNKAARQLLPEDLKDNTTLFPNEDDMRHAQFTQDIGDSIKLYEEFWEKLKSGK